MALEWVKTAFFTLGNSVKFPSLQSFSNQKLILVGEIQNRLFSCRPEPGKLEIDGQPLK